MKRSIFLLCVIFSLSAVAAFAGSSPDRLWREINDASLQRNAVRRTVIPQAYRTYTLDKNELQAILREAPMEFTDSARQIEWIITLPMPDGTFSRFRIEESPIMEPGLAEKFPEIKTYRGQGIDDLTATARFDFMPGGFHAMILSTSGTVLIDPYAKGDTANYISYFKRDVAPSFEPFICHVGEKSKKDFYTYDYEFLPDVSAPEVTNGTQLRTYRLALAATREYTATAGGTVAGAQAAQVVVMNRVNGVYERDVAIRMVIIANNNLIIYTAEPDPYTNNDGFTMLTQNQANLTATIGNANYDIGHVFSTGGGGVAALNSPCNAASKAQGVTGLPTPVGDAFAIDFVAHEMGHQFGGNHTFNTSCGGNRAASAAYEPGSGITIMGYAGVCGAQDLALNSIDTFHVKSLEEIVAFKEAGGSCGPATATGNTPPTVSVVGGTSFNIPVNTPFSLTAAATDANGDTVTYDWQEYDLGAATSAIPNTDATGARPIFRPYLPTASGTRYFPSLQYILNNANVPPSTYGASLLTGELLPTITRTMSFQAIARDNRASGGGINTATATVNVSNTSGPFAVTAPNTAVTWNGATSQTITWNVAGTTAAPVSAANVEIALSLNGGNTFPLILAASTPNDGSQTVTIPNTTTTQARIRVRGAGNIFFDISNTNFNINVSTAASVSVGGRVLTANGQAVGGARVSLTNPQGETVAALTNPFGYYRFDEIPAGAAYVFSVRSKRYSFNDSVLFVSEDVENYNFTALP